MGSTGLKHRVARLEQGGQGPGRVITIEVAEEAEDRRDIIDRALSEAELVPTDADLVVVLRRFYGEPDHARVLSVQRMTGR